jgi:uncharacterized protein (TIGR03067 family)
MFVTKLKWLALAVLAVGLHLTSAGLVPHPILAAGLPQEAQKPADPPRPEDKKVTAVDKKEAIQKELKKLEGTWTIVSWEVQGRKLAGEELKAVQSLQIAIKGNLWTHSHPQWMYKVTIQIDPTKDPKTIDLTFPLPMGKKVLTRGIYQLSHTTEGETLTVSRANHEGLPRPKEFKTTERGGLLMVLKRADK